MSGWDAVALASVAVAAALYLRGSRRVISRDMRTRFERGAFWTGTLVMTAAVAPPLDGLATELFSAHMLQHELMMLVAAPLIIAGRPLPMWLAGLPWRLRRPATRVLQGAVVTTAWRAVTLPPAAWLLHGLVVWLWHWPLLYEAAVRHEALHAVQHASFAGTSALFWWGMINGRYGRAGYGAAVVYVFTTAVHTGMLGAALTFARVPLYLVYEAPAAARGADLLADQQLAGLLMWIPGGLLLTLFGIGLCAAWLGEAARRDRGLPV